MLGISTYKELWLWDVLWPSKNEQDNLENEMSEKQQWYVIILANMNNRTSALNLILDNCTYLDSRTKNVRYFLPGYVNMMSRIRQHGIMRGRQMTKVMHLMQGKDGPSFNVKGFLETIDWLENGNPQYEYSENAEMILLPYTNPERKEDRPICHEDMPICDFENMLWYDLDEMVSENKNVLQFIRRAVRVVNEGMTVQETKIHMEGLKSEVKPSPTHTVFIAGAKRLTKERDGIRAIFSQLSNHGKILFRAYTYEDFERSFTPSGRQSEYNEFICNEADSIIFVLDSRVGGITYHEFEIAMESFLQHGYPKIYVYNMEGNGVDEDEISMIKENIDVHHQYYTDYLDLRDLKEQVRRDFSHIKMESRSLVKVNTIPQDNDLFLDSLFQD